MERSDFCTFRIGPHLLAVEVDRVQEVLPVTSITPVPLAPLGVVGLINLRGQIVAVFDLRGALLVPQEGEEPDLHVVVRTEEGLVSLLAHEIGDVLAMARGTLEPVPGTLRGIPREILRGVHKLDNGVVLVLDVDQALLARAAAPQESE